MPLEERIRVSQLQAGDILLLEPSDDWISKLIVKITKSPVSHTALSCGTAAEEGTVIEEIPHGAVKESIKSRKGRTTYIMRLRSDIKDFQPVMNIAEQYVCEKRPYAFAQLPFIALYCIVYQKTGGKKLRRLIIRLMRLAMEVIIELENKLIYDGKKAMMCSQFAYHCYREAGEAYEIHMKEDDMVKQLDQMIHIISQEAKKYNEQVFRLRGESAVISEDEVTEVLSELYSELDNQNGQLNQASEPLEDDYIVEVSRFCVQFVKSFSKEGCDHSKKEITYYLEKLREMKEYFISPGDLLSNTQNLICVGTVDYEGCPA